MKKKKRKIVSGRKALWKRKFQLGRPLYIYMSLSVFENLSSFITEVILDEKQNFTFSLGGMGMAAGITAVGGEGSREERGLHSGRKATTGRKINSLCFLWNGSRSSSSMAV